MTMGAAATRAPVARRHRDLLLAAAGLTYVLIVLGGVVCVTGSGQACPDWPGCYGQIIPPARIDSVIEYSHRFVAGVTGLFIVVAAVTSRRRTPAVRWVTRPTAMAVGFLLVVMAFGALAVLRGLSPVAAAVDIGSALTVQALVVAAAVVAYARHRNPALPDRLAFRGPWAALTLWTLGSVFAVLVSGVLVAAPGSLARCLGWPIYSTALAPVVAGSWLPAARLAAGGIADVSIAALVIAAWRTQRGRAAVLRAALAVGALRLVELALGLLLLATGANVFLLVLYVAAAAALWAATAVLAVLSGLSAA